MLMFQASSTMALEKKHAMEDLDNYIINFEPPISLSF